MKLYKILALTFLAIPPAIAMQGDSPLTKHQAHREETSRLREHSELLENLGVKLKKIIAPLVEENVTLKKQLIEMAGANYTAPYLSSRSTVQEELLQDESLGTEVNFVETIFTDLRRKLLGIVSDLVGENNWLKNQLAAKGTGYRS